MLPLDYHYDDIMICDDLMTYTSLTPYVYPQL